MLQITNTINMESQNNLIENEKNHKNFQSSQIFWIL